MRICAWHFYVHARLTASFAVRENVPIVASCPGRPLDIAGRHHRPIVHHYLPVRLPSILKNGMHTPRRTQCVNMPRQRKRTVSVAKTFPDRDSRLTICRPPRSDKSLPTKLNAGLCGARPTPNARRTACSNAPNATPPPDAVNQP